MTTVNTKTTRQLVAAIKADAQDFEWYPTTDEMIAAIKQDMAENTSLNDAPSILDCGAGDGRVLNALTQGEKYAIEKSKPLLDALDKSIFVVGTEFAQQTLIDKRVELVYANPPYSAYAQWATKIIAEANASFIYLVIPERWRRDEAIQQAIAARKGQGTTVGSFDFLNAERAARAKVDIVRIELCVGCGGHRYGPTVDPFERWFNDNFNIAMANTATSKYDLDRQAKETLSDAVSQSLLEGGSLISVLDQLYRRDLEKLIATYQKLCDIDAALLDEMNVDLDSVRGALQQKIEGLKDRYWQELFDHLDKITRRLTHDSRRRLLDTLTAHTHVDFTVSNAYAIVTWVIKNSNVYFDEQLVTLVERMTERANVQYYVSNQHTFGDEQWRYCRMPDNLARYKLDYRIVLARIGGLDKESWYARRSNNGLSEGASHFLDDLCTVATNLGFEVLAHHRARHFHWATHAKNHFLFHDPVSGQPIVLFEAKAYKNGNLHIKCNQLFICRLNVEFGRLKGWLKSPKEAADELAVPVEQALQGFHANLRLDNHSVLALGFDAPAQAVG